MDMIVRAQCVAFRLEALEFPAGYRVPEVGSAGQDAFS